MGGAVHVDDALGRWLLRNAEQRQRKEEANNLSEDP